MLAVRLSLLCLAMLSPLFQQMNVFAQDAVALPDQATLPAGIDKADLDRAIAKEPLLTRWLTREIAYTLPLEWTFNNSIGAALDRAHFIPDYLQSLELCPSGENYELQINIAYASRHCPRFNKPARSENDETPATQQGTLYLTSNDSSRFKQLVVRHVDAMAETTQIELVVRRHVKNEQGAVGLLIFAERYEFIPASDDAPHKWSLIGKGHLVDFPIVPPENHIGGE